MKKIYLSVLLVSILFGQTIAAIPLPQLGLAGSFALFTTAGAVGNTGISTITGNIGTNTGAITGFGTPTIVVGALYNTNSVTAQCAADLLTGYNQITGTTNTATHGPVLGAGETLTTGVYAIAAAGSALGILTLDAQGDPNAIFIFKFGGAFTTAAGATVVLANGALASHVCWVAEGAISMAALTIMKGTLIAHPGAVSMGAGGSLEGGMLSTAGAVNVYGDNVYLPTSTGFNWIGLVSTDWNTPANWLNNAVPTSTDRALIGVTQLFNYFPNVPAAFGSVSVASVTFGGLGGQSSGVVVNAGSTLNVLGLITYQSDVGSLFGYTCTVSGAGTINADSIAVFANTTLPGQSYSGTFESLVTNLNVSGNIVLTSTMVGTDVFNATFNLTGGTTLVNGRIHTNNTAGSTSTFSITPIVTGTLQLTNALPLSGLSNLGTNAINFKNGGATVEYAGASQTVYNDGSIPGLSTGVSYQHIKLSGTGLKTLQPGNLNISGDFTNSMANDANNNINLVTNSINFIGATQSLAGGGGRGTIMKKVRFSGTGIKTMLSGKFNVNNSGTLTMVSPATLIAGTTTVGGIAYLTLLSDSTSTATVYTPAGTIIAGNVNVQRHISSGVGTRGYRLVTSPVNVNLNTSGAGYLGLSYLNANVPAGGKAYYGIYTQGSGTGFTLNGSANPTIYLYDESRPTNNTSFVSGKNIGVYAISGSSGTPAYCISTIGGMPAVVTTGVQVPVGNSYLLYFVGNNQSVNAASSRVPDATTLTATGYLNQGNVPVKFWKTNSTTIPYDATTGTVNYGLNQIGNPYASTINLVSLYADNYNISSDPIGPSFYELIPGGNYIAYNAANGYVSDSRASQYIISGQGFIIQATGASPAETITFKEDQKVAYPAGFTSATTPKMMMDIPSGRLLINSHTPALKSDPVISSFPGQTVSAINAGLHLQLTRTDGSYAQTGIYFNDQAKDDYSSSEDAVQVDGGVSEVLLSSSSSNNIKLSINSMSGYAAGKRIHLNVSASFSGTYTLSLADIAGIDTTGYNVYLVDNQKNDSLDLVHYKSYAFDLNTTDTNSFGSNRFTLALEHKFMPPYILASFSGLKVSNGVRLNWNAVGAGNYTGYTLQKLNINGRYDDLYSIQSATSISAYSFTDVHPVTGDNIYRLAQTGFTGTISYSANLIISYNSIAPTGVLTLYPNPAKNIMKVSLAYTAVNSSNYVADIYNSMGSSVKHEIVTGPNWSDDVSAYKQGIYIMEVKDSRGNLIGQAKFIKVE